VNRAAGRPPWWTPRVGEREVLLSLAATPGPLPAAVAARLAEGRDPATLLRVHSPDPGSVAARLDGLGLRFLVSGDEGWPLAATPPDPPCAWLFASGPAPPGAAASVAVVGGRRASPLRRAAARSIGAGLARAGWCVVSGGAVGVDAAAHAGALDAGGRTVVVLGCGLDVAYPRANTGLFARVRSGGGTLVSEHPLSAQPRAAHFLPRNRLIAALSAAVVVVEAAEDSGSLSTARAAGSRGAGHVLVLPGAPWDPGAAGCNQLIRDGATLVHSLTDILEELGTTATASGGSPADASVTATASGGSAAGATASAAGAFAPGPRCRSRRRRHRRRRRWLVAACSGGQGGPDVAARRPAPDSGSPGRCHRPSAGRPGRRPARSRALGPGPPHRRRRPGHRASRCRRRRRVSCAPARAAWSSARHRDRRAPPAREGA
jgi:DNA processing protein